VPERRAPAPALPAPSTQVASSSTSVPPAPSAPPAEDPRRARDRELLGEVVSTIGKVADAVSRQSSATAEPGVRPTTASGWFALAQTQSPEEAARSLREALSLSPGWSDAQIALCVALAATRDPGAVPACDAALRLRPGAVEVLAARGRAKLDAGDARGALADLDRVVRTDPDPLWRLLRANARSAVGDHAGARTDREHACQLGLAEACTGSP
jgi:predicted Zn-dependent protease